MTEKAGTVRGVELDVKCKTMDLYPFYFMFVLRRALPVLVLVPPAVVAAQGLATGDFSFVPYLVRFPWPQVWLILFLFSIFLRPYFISRSILRKDSFRFGDGHFSVDDQGISVRREYSESKVLWPAIRKVNENSRSFILSLGTYTAIILPKHSFSTPKQMSALRSLVLDHVEGQICMRKSESDAS